MPVQGTSRQVFIGQFSPPVPQYLYLNSRKGEKHLDIVDFVQSAAVVVTEQHVLRIGVGGSQLILESEAK